MESSLGVKKAGKYLRSVLRMFLNCLKFLIDFLLTERYV